VAEFIQMLCKAAGLQLKDGFQQLYIGSKIDSLIWKQNCK